MPKSSSQQDSEGSKPPTVSRNEKHDSSEDMQDLSPHSGAQFHPTSTSQKKLSASKSPLQNNLNIYWIQKSGEDGSGSFVLQSHHRKRLITSHRSPDLRGEQKQKKHTDAKKGRKKSIFSLKNKTTVAVGLGLAGFIVQFEGLRLINWSCSIAQLIALVLVTLFRGLARRKMVGQPITKEIHEGHEMDGLAIEIARQYLKDQDFTFEFTTDFAYCIQSKKADTDAQKVLDMRMRLARITKWRGAKDEEALCLANAIELAIQKLQPDLDDPHSNNDAWIWLRVCTRKGNKNLGNDSISFELKKQESNAGQGKWTVSALQLEAALSLAEYALIKKKTRDYTDAEDARVPDYFLVLGPSEKSLHVDLFWWTKLTSKALEKGFTVTERVHPNNPQLRLGFRGFEAKPDVLKGLEMAVSQENLDENEVQQLPDKLDSHMAMAGNMYAANETLLPRFSKTKASRNTSNETNSDGGSNRNTTQRTTQRTSDNTVCLELPAEQALAIHLFSAFIWGIASRVRVPKYTSSSSVRALPDVPGGIHIQEKEMWIGRFRCQEIEDIVTEVQKLGLGARNSMAILLSIIAPMSIVDTLPNEAYVEELLSSTLSKEKSCSWGDLSIEYETLLEIVQIRGKQDRFARRAVAAMLELIARMVEKPIQVQDWASSEREQHIYLEGMRTIVEKEKIVLGILKWLGTVYNGQPRRSRYEKAVEALLCSPLHECLKNAEQAPEEEQWRYLGSTDVLGCSEAHRRLFDWVRERGKTTYQFKDGDGLIDSENVRHILQPCLGEVCDITGQTILHQLVNDLPSRQFESFRNRVCRVAAQSKIPWTDASSKTGRNGQTPLHRAAVTSNTLAAKFLISEGAKANAEDNVGRTPLMLAACYGASLVICKHLLLGGNKESDVNFQDQNNEAALHMAARHGQKEIVKFLLEQKGIELEILDGPPTDPSKRKTPQQRATAAGHGEIADLIGKKIADQDTSIAEEVNKSDVSVKQIEEV